MGETSQRRVGRPSEQVLSRVQIIETALALLDEHGEHGFGMRDIARALGVRPSALYNHVDGKEDIHRGMRELIGERISAGADAFETESWETALAGWARAYRDAFAAHPPTIALLAVMPIDPASHVTVVYDRVVGMLHRAGWERGEALNILVSLESFILGSALDAAAAPDMLHPGDRDDVPDFSAAYRERDERVRGSRVGPADQAFETGLRLMLGGLRAEAAERDARRAAPRSKRPGSAIPVESEAVAAEAADA